MAALSAELFWKTRLSSDEAQVASLDRPITAVDSGISGPAAWLESRVECYDPHETDLGRQLANGRRPAGQMMDGWAMPRDDERQRWHPLEVERLVAWRDVSAGATMQETRMATARSRWMKHGSGDPRGRGRRQVMMTLEYGVL